MQDVIKSLGLNEKEAKAYLFILENGSVPASLISQKIGESRTNTYMITDALQKQGLVEYDDSQPVRRFIANDPVSLQKVLSSRHQQLRQQNSALQTILPQLSSLYQLGQHRPGVVYFEGIEGFKALLKDMSKGDDEVSIIGSNDIPESREIREILLKGTAKRKQKGIKSRIIFYEDAKNWSDITSFQKRGFEVRFWGKTLTKGEIAMYANKVALTTYEPNLIVTVLTDQIMADTFSTLFETIWQNAEPL